MVTSNLTILGAEDSAIYVGFKCEDPHEHIVDVYFEPR
jgi:hypothetical protein